MKKTSAAKNEKREIDRRVIELHKSGLKTTAIAEAVGKSYPYIRSITDWLEAGGESVALADFHNKPQSPVISAKEEAIVREVYEKLFVRHPAGDRTPVSFPKLSDLSRCLAGKIAGVTRKNPRRLIRILICLHLGFEYKHTRCDPIYRGTWFELCMRDTGERIVIFAAVNAAAGRLLWCMTHAGLEEGYIAFLRHLNDITPTNRRIHLSMNLPEPFMRTQEVLRVLGTMGPGRFDFDFKEWPESMECFTVKVTLPNLKTITRLAVMSGEKPAKAAQRSLEEIAVAFLADRIGRQENCRTSHSVHV